MNREDQLLNRSEIIKMAREAGFGDGIVEFIGLPIFERFAALIASRVAASECERIITTNTPEIEKANAYIKELEEAVAAEREACAKVCDEIETCSDAEFYGDEFASAIRARKKTT